MPGFTGGLSCRLIWRKTSHLFPFFLSIPQASLSCAYNESLLCPTHGEYFLVTVCFSLTPPTLGSKFASGKRSPGFFINSSYPQVDLDLNSPPISWGKESLTQLLAASLCLLSPYTLPSNLHTRSCVQNTVSTFQAQKIPSSRMENHGNRRPALIPNDADLDDQLRADIESRTGQAPVYMPDWFWNFEAELQAHHRVRSSMRRQFDVHAGGDRAAIIRARRHVSCATCDKMIKRILETSGYDNLESLEKAVEDEGNGTVTGDQGVANDDPTADGTKSEPNDPDETTEKKKKERRVKKCASF